MPGRWLCPTGPVNHISSWITEKNCGRSSAYIPTCPLIQTRGTNLLGSPQAETLTTGRRTVIAVVAAASFITGAAVGWLLAMIAASAAMSFSQERMQRKVRYWQAETALARAQAKAERLASIHRLICTDSSAATRKVSPDLGRWE
jgi:hypothetical protein